MIIFPLVDVLEYRTIASLVLPPPYDADAFLRRTPIALDATA